MEIKSYEDFRRATNRCDYRAIKALKDNSPSLYGAYASRQEKDLAREAEIKEKGFCFEDVMSQASK